MRIHKHFVEREALLKDIKDFRDKNNRLPDISDLIEIVFETKRITISYDVENIIDIKEEGEDE